MSNFIIGGIGIIIYGMNIFNAIREQNTDAILGWSCSLILFIILIIMLSTL